MDFIIEHRIGDAEVVIEGGRYRKGAARHIELARAFSSTGSPDAISIEAFLQPLRSLAEIDLDALTSTLPAKPLPPGYRHFRLYDGRTGELWTGSFVTEEGRSLTLHDILFGALNHPTLQISEWTSAEWLPDMIPGVLDIELAFETEPRTKPMRLMP